MTTSSVLRTFLLIACTAISISAQDAGPSPQKPTDDLPAVKEQLWQASRKGDLELVKKAIDAGIDVNSKTDYGATALSFAADRGHLDIVKLLIEKKADANVKDTFYGATPMDWAAGHGHYEIMKELVLGGSTNIAPAFAKSISEKDIEFVKSVSKNKNLTYRLAKTNLDLAKTLEFKDAVQILEPIVAELQPKFSITKENESKYVGKYRLNETTVLDIRRKDKFLAASINGSRFDLEAADEKNFSGPNLNIVFRFEDGNTTGIDWSAGGSELFLKKLTVDEIKKLAENPSAPAANVPEATAGKFAESSPKSRAEDLAISSNHWPQFRGNGARGVADGQNPPIEWNVEKKHNVAWSTEIPGLGHSCPVIWGNYVFVTTAISEEDTDIKTGLYGDVASVDDQSEHEFVTYCLNKSNGKIVWKKTACKAVPQVKRHLKSTHANSTVATNGKYVVSWFGSEGIYCYTMEGKLVWKKDLGLLDSGWFYDREYQWQFGASPIIEDDKLLLLCDIQDQSFLACHELKTGDLIWKTKRDEIPSWSSPTVIDTPKGKVVVTNATKASRAYDFETGKEVWRIEKNSEIAVPTPFAARNLIFVSSGYRPVQPIYAIRLDAEGDLTLDKTEKKSEYVAWSESRGGPYMPSPIVYGDYLYICSNSGILTCYQAASGKQVYKKRLRMKGIRSFVGSPIAADGHLYLTSEDGETAVVKAGPQYKLVANNFCGENCLTTAAISEGKFFLRTQKKLFAFETGVGKSPAESKDESKSEKK